MNRFRHQLYPTTPEIPPRRELLQCHDADGFDFSRLHADLGVCSVLLVHGTFMGDDPFGIGEVLRSLAGALPGFSKPAQHLVDSLCHRTRPFITGLTDDVGNYTPAYQEQFQQLVGPDPQVHLLTPPWSGQNHHLARADLAVRIADWLLDQHLTGEQRCLLWGHSHAGNAFALLSNLLANERNSVNAFFNAAGEQSAPHWHRVRQELAAASAPHPVARHVLHAAFGCPVRYGWDSLGLRSLVHLLHDCLPMSAEESAAERAQQIQTQPLFPPQTAGDVLTARYGDWVQAFAVAGTDLATLTSLQENHGLQMLLERNLPASPENDTMSPLDPLRLIPSGPLRCLCQRWTTGTRCHSTGLNLLVSYQPCGERWMGVALEKTMLGHGVATTQAWLPVHLKLITQALLALEPGDSR